MAAAESGRADDALVRLRASEQLCSGLTASLAKSQAQVEELLQDRDKEDQEAGSGGSEGDSRADNAAAALLRMQAQVVLLQDENAQLRNNKAPEAPTWPQDNSFTWGEQQQQQQPIADALPCLTPADPKALRAADEGEEDEAYPNFTDELSQPERLSFGYTPQEAPGHNPGEWQ